MSRLAVFLFALVSLGSGCATMNRVELTSTTSVEPVTITAIRAEDGTERKVEPAHPVQVKDGHVALARRPAGTVTVLGVGNGGATLELDHAEFDGIGAAAVLAIATGIGLAPGLASAPFLLFAPALFPVWAVANGAGFVGAVGVGAAFAFLWTSHAPPQAVALDLAAGTATSTPPGRARLKVPASSTAEAEPATSTPTPPTAGSAGGEGSVGEGG
jgi:hypothetical protein